MLARHGGRNLGIGAAPASHDPKHDDLALIEALQSDAFYVGALGSKQTNAKRRERLAGFDLSAAQIGRLHGPVGLPIGSRTPPEMTIATLTHLTAERNGVQLRAQKESHPEPRVAAAQVGVHAGVLIDVGMPEQLALLLEGVGWQSESQ